MSKKNAGEGAAEEVNAVERATEIEQWPLNRLKAYKRNAKKHPPEQIQLLAQILKKHGFDQPIVVDTKGVIIKGHGRWLAARALNMVTVPVIVRDLPPAAAAEARIADNRVAEFGWDFDQLVADVVGNLPQGFDADITGWSLEQLGLAVDPDTGEIEQTGEVAPEAPVAAPIVEDEPPPPPKKAKSKLGQLWQLGDHRLMCGDSTRAELYAALMSTDEGPAQPFMMVTDPPYGVEYDPTARPKGSGDGKVHSTGKVLNDDRADWLAAYQLFTGAVAYVWHASLFSNVVFQNLVDAGFDIRSNIIWAKQQLVFGRAHYHWQHEPAWYAVRKGAQANWTGDRKQTTLWQIANKISSKGEDMNTVHGTQKPVECMARPMMNHGEKGDLIYDPFLGSGTTIVAAEQMGRRCFGFELSPNYVDTIIERWEKFTGGKAKLLTQVR